MLTDLGRQIRPFTRGGNARRYALSGLMRCGGTMPDGTPCGHVMVSMTTSAAGGRAFVCSAQATGGCGRMRIAMDPLEAYVTEQVLVALDGPDLAAALADDTDDDGTETRTREALAADEHALEALTDERDDPTMGITDAEYRRRRAKIITRMDARRADLATAVGRHTRSSLPSADELRDQWDVRDNLWRRTILAAVIDRVDVSPHPLGATTHLSRRRGEHDDQLRARREVHQAAILDTRVTIRWRA